MTEKNREFRFFGPPGCGKTTRLQRYIAATAKSRGPDSIIVTSFTKAAAVELAGRDLPIPEDRISTLHAACFRALGTTPIAETKVKEWNERMHYGMQLTGSKGDTPKADDIVAVLRDGAPGDAYLDEYNISRSKLKPVESMSLEAQDFAREWESWKTDNGYIDFTDMISLAVQEVPVCPGNPEVIFADETQDLSPLQMKLLRQWAKNADVLVLAGDDDQAIFTFAGADPRAFLTPEVPPEDEEILSQSYRVPQAVQAAAQDLIEHVSFRKEKPYKARDEVGEVKMEQVNWKDPDTILPMIDEALATEYPDDEPSHRAKVMILASCSYLLGPLVARLKADGYPFHNPYRTKRGDWNPLGARRGTATKDRLLAYFRPSPEVWGGASRFWTYDDIDLFVGLLSAKGNLHRGAKKKLKETNEAERFHEADIGWLLANVFTEEAMAHVMDTDPDWLRANLLRTKATQVEYPLRVILRHGGSAVRQSPEIVVGTIHSVKGGEADWVILLTDLSQRAAISWKQGGVEEQDAIRRTFYVGMTRARHRLTYTEPIGGAGYYADLTKGGMVL